MTGIFGFCIDWGPAENVVPASEADLTGTGAKAIIRNGHYFTSQIVTSIENDSFVSGWIAENVCPTVADGKPVILDRSILNRLCRFLRSLGTAEGKQVRDSLADWAVDLSSDPDLKDSGYRWYYRVKPVATQVKMI